MNETKELPTDAELSHAINSGALKPSAQVFALLEELRVMLAALTKNGAHNSIDIRSLPLLPSDYETLMQVLGCGEVSATINALGVSEIKETRYSGIWLLRHYNTHDEIIAELIEVTPLPDILKTQAPDLIDSSEKLLRYLQKLQTNNN